MSLYYSSAALSVVLLKSLLTTRHVTWINATGLLLSLGVYIGTVFALGITIPYGGPLSLSLHTERIVVGCAWPAG
jgi:hypothetical protein